MVLANEANIPIKISPSVMANDVLGVTSMPIYGKKILLPINIKITDSAYLRYAKRCTASAKRKYNALKPKIAKMLLVYTINTSWVMRKIAGILSKAKITSIVSIIINAKNNGVM